MGKVIRPISVPSFRYIHYSTLPPRRSFQTFILCWCTPCKTCPLRNCSSSEMAFHCIHWHSRISSGRPPMCHRSSRDCTGNFLWWGTFL